MPNKYLNPNTAAYSGGPGDTRNDLGYGKTSSGRSGSYTSPGGSIGSPLSLGHALYKGEKGPYDPTHPDNIDDDIELEDWEIDFIEFFNSSYGDIGGHRKAVDSLPKTNPFYFAGSAGAGSTTINAGFDGRDEADLIFENDLRFYIKSILNEYTQNNVNPRRRGKSISGRSYVTGDKSNPFLGDPYPPKNVNVPMSPSGRSYNVNRIEQQGNKTASGTKLMNKLKLRDLFGDDDSFYLSDENDEDGLKTSWEIFGYRWGEDGKVEDDLENVKLHNKNN